MPCRALLVGCGFTGRRVASLLLERGWQVTATTRVPSKLRRLRELGAGVVQFDALTESLPAAASEGASILLSVPTLRLGEALDEPTPRILDGLSAHPAHVTYLSTTGVYGAQATVDESTAAAPATERQRLRTQAENAVRSVNCAALVLRPAAIYGPNRGVHAAMRKDSFRLARGGGRCVSRIHVDDLAAVTAEAMARRLEGTFPVADMLPATSREVALFCANLLGLNLPPEVAACELDETRLGGRRVDGRAVLRQTGVELRYPTYREGIPASIAEERTGQP